MKDTTKEKKDERKLEIHSNGLTVLWDEHCQRLWRQQFSMDMLLTDFDFIEFLERVSDGNIVYLN